MPQLLADQAVQHRTVGLILDLSNHETLYEADLPAGLEYEHIMLQSKVFPHPAAINEVVKAALSFWSRKPNLYIAIHCAYGALQQFSDAQVGLTDVCDLLQGL